MRPRRAIAVALVVLLVGVGVIAAASGDQPGAGPPSGSTLRGRWVDRDGNGVLERGPGEPLRDRTELSPPSRRGRVLASFGQVTDAHVRDEESPARLTLLDRLGTPFTSTFRPQEALSAQVLAGAVTSLNRDRLDGVVVTGDLIDNAQRNELSTAVAVLDGGRVDPDSGRPGYQGPQQAGDPDAFFYRPDVDAPREPGLLARAQLPFRSPGLRAPWFAVAGNHDLLFQGELRPGRALQAIAVGDGRLVELSPRARRLARRGERSLARAAELLRAGLPGRSVRTAPDPERAFLSPSELARRLRAPLDHSFDLGPHVRGIALDLVRRDRGSGGLVAAGQLRWLRSELRRAGRRRVVLFSHQPLRSTQGGGAVLRLLARDRRVVAAVSGHTHRNRIRPFRRLWLIETASLADYPQHARELRLVETARGLALETWMVDTAPSPLADASRRLAFLDVQGGRVTGDAGGPGDRNARLFLSR